MKEIGFLKRKNKDGSIEKSSTNLITVTSVFICVAATCGEIAGKVVAAIDGNVVDANWEGIAMLCGAVLVGTGIAKFGKNSNIGNHDE